MHRKFIPIVLLLLLWSAHLLAYFQIQGHDILDNSGNKIILKGVGLGGWLVPEGYMLHLHPGIRPDHRQPFATELLSWLARESARRFYADYIKYYVTKNDIQMIADWGYNHIRLPFEAIKCWMRKRNHPYLLMMDLLLLIPVSGWCKAAGLPVILDMHCAPGGQNPGNISDSDGTARLWLERGYQDKIVEIWKAIAARYADEEWVIGYDLINEPVLPDGYTGSDLRNLYIRIRNEIRSVDSNHILFIEGNWYATDFANLTPIFDTKMVYSFHKYWNVNTQESIQDYLNIRNSTAVPLWLGETGENSNHWFAEMVRLCEKNNIGWCNWTHKKFATTTAPLSAELPANWNQIQSGSPSQNEAVQILDKFIENLKTENCRTNPGVNTAYLDAGFLDFSQPVKSVAPGVRIYASDYDLGGQNSAYYDTDYLRTNWDWSVNDPWNIGGEYRNDGVDIGITSDSESNGYYVGWTTTGEWINYTITVADSGFYDLHLRIASPDGGTLSIAVNDIMAGVISVPATGGWDSWQTVSLDNVFLSSGSSKVRFNFITGGYNISWFEFIGPGTHIDPLPEAISLVGRNYPNPFNATTTIPIKLVELTPVKLQVFDLAGKMVCTVIDSPLNGTQYLQWSGKNDSGKLVAAGVYIYQLQVGEDVFSDKMIFLK